MGLPSIGFGTGTENSIALAFLDWLGSIGPQQQYREEAAAQEQEARGLVTGATDTALTGQTVRQGGQSFTAPGALHGTKLSPIDEWLISMGLKEPPVGRDVSYTVTPAGAPIDEEKSYPGAIQISQEALQGLDDLMRAANERTDRGLAMTAGLGEQAIADTRQQYNIEGQRELMELANRGYGGSLAANSRLANVRQREDAVNRINDSVRALRATQFGNLSGDALRTQAANVGNRAAFAGMPSQIASQGQTNLANLVAGIQIQPPNSFPGVELAQVLTGANAGKGGGGGDSDAGWWSLGSSLTNLIPYVGPAISAGMNMAGGEQGSPGAQYGNFNSNQAAATNYYNTNYGGALPPNSVPAGSNFQYTY